MVPIHVKTCAAPDSHFLAAMVDMHQVCTWGPEVENGCRYAILPTGRGAMEPNEIVQLVEWMERYRVSCDQYRKSFTLVPCVGEAEAPAPIVDPAPRRTAASVQNRPVRAKVGVSEAAAHPATGTAAPMQSTVSSGRPVILHILPWDLTVGGTQRLLDSWCRQEGHRWDVHIVTIGTIPGTWKLPQASVRQLRTPSEVAAFCRALRPDVVVSHNCAHPFCAGSSGFPQVWYVHGERILAAECPSWAVPACFVENYPQQGHRSWLPLPRHVVRLGVDTEAFAPRYKQQSGGAERLVAGIVGRLSPEKVPASFVEALLTWKPGPWRIRFIGAGVLSPYHDEVRQRLAKLPHVEFVGDVDPLRMPAAYGELDALLVPSSTETGSYAIAEAMACAVPIVCRDLPGPRFTTGEHGLFAAGDAALLDCLRRLDSTLDREREATEALDWARGNLEWKQHERRLTAIFASAAQPRCSVLMPVWNTPPEFLREAVQSVVDQTEVLWELVAVDDGSDNQETCRELRKLAADDPRIRVHRLPHGGVSAALNAGLKFCRSDLVARMDADDIMYPERLEKQLAYMARHPDVGVLGAQLRFSTTGQVTTHPAVVTQAELQGASWLINHPTVMYRRSVVGKYGGYDEALKSAEDFGLWLKLIFGGVPVHNLQEVLLTYRIHGQQVTHRNNTSAVAVSLRDRYKLPQLYWDAPAVFDRIYTTGRWGKVMSSGDGSTPESTAHLLKALPVLFCKYHVQTVLDGGCGTSTWMRQAAAGVMRYIGLDVSPVVIEANRKLPPMANWEYRRWDLTWDPVHEKSDLCISRDVIGHLPADRGVMLLRNAARCSTLLLTTHWPGVENRDVEVGGWRKVNLTAAPYNLPPPLEMIEEVDKGKYLALFDLREKAW